MLHYMSGMQRILMQTSSHTQGNTCKPAAVPGMETYVGMTKSSDELLCTLEWSSHQIYQAEYLRSCEQGILRGQVGAFLRHAVHAS